MHELVGVGHRFATRPGRYHGSGGARALGACGKAAAVPGSRAVRHQIAEGEHGRRAEHERHDPARTVRSLTHSAHSADRQLLLADARVGRGWVLVRLIAPPARPSRRGTRSRCR